MRSFKVGQIATAFGVSPKTVANWCNRGYLPCYRLPPKNKGEGDRRILPKNVVAFCENQNIPIPAELGLFDNNMRLVE